LTKAIAAKLFSLDGGSVANPESFYRVDIHLDNVM
jgi:hypothetical protein